MFYQLYSVLFIFGNELCYTAWIQVNEGKVPVTAVFKTSEGFKHGGAVVAESNCWSMLKGGVTVDASGPVQLYFEVHYSKYD